MPGAGEPSRAMSSPSPDGEAAQTPDSLSESTPSPASQARNATFP